MEFKRTILAVENDHKARLTRLLNRLGYSVIAVTGMEAALARIQHLRIGAAVIDGTGRNDPLEFVLNAREFNETLPIIVVGPARDSELYNVLIKQINVTVVPEDERRMDAEIGKAVEEAIN